MKRLIVTALLVLGLGTTQAYSQEIMGGIKLDANLSNFFLKDFDGINSKIGFGLSIGGYTKIDFMESFALQPEILLHYKTSTIEEERSGDEMDFQYFGVEIPLYAMYQTNLQTGKCFFGAGPYLGFGINALYKSDYLTEDLDLYKEYDGQKSVMNRFDFGIGVILGYEFSNRLQIAATWKMGVINLENANKDNTSMRNNTFSLGLGYRFN